MGLFEEVRSGLIGRYEVQREIARGGMATVFLARDTRHDRLVAIKVLDPDLARTVGAARFNREIRMVARLTHPNILPLLDSGEFTGPRTGVHLWYAMPYVAGETLRGRLQRERHLPLSDAVRIAAEVAGALDYAHREGVVHRDIKPENLLLQDGHALVADFGIGRSLDPVAGDGLTRTGLMLGTPAYASPEQAAGDEPLDGRTDVYSLGCVLYEMLSGSQPYTGPTAAAIVAQVLTATPTDLAVMRPAAAPLGSVVGRAMERIPADRFPDARSFADALQAALPETGGEPSPPPRRWARAGFGAVAVGVLVGAGSWFASMTSATDGSAPPGRIVVLPIESLTEEADDFSRILHSELIDALASAGSLPVISRRAVLEYEGSMVPGAVARAFGATHVVDVTTTEADGAVRVAARLYDQEGEALSGVSPRTRPKVDVLRLVTDVAGDIAGEIEGVLAARPSPADPPSISNEAFELWAKGHRLFEQGGPRRVVPVDSALLLLDSAIVALEGGTQAAPRFSRAWAHLARARHWRASGSSTALADSLHTLAVTAADSALRLDPDDAVAWSARGFALHRLWDFEGAERSYAEGAERNPNVDHASRVFLQISRGRVADAIASYQRARELEPALPGSEAQYLRVLACGGRHDEALQTTDFARLAPLGAFGRATRGDILAAAGRYAEAIAEYGRSLTRGDLPPALLALSLARGGDPQQAARLVATRRAAGVRDPVDYLAVGDTAGLIDHLSEGARERRQSLLLLPCNPVYPELLSIPDARRILVELGLPTALDR